MSLNATTDRHNTLYAEFCKHRIAFWTELHRMLNATITQQTIDDLLSPNRTVADFSCAHLHVTGQHRTGGQLRVIITCDVRDWQTNNVTGRFEMHAMADELQAFAPWAAQAILLYHTRKGNWADIKKIPSTTDNNPMTFIDTTHTVYTSAACAETAREALDHRR